jgi:glycosyltransferase involved in cell wall biosynthesis
MLQQLPNHDLLIVGEGAQQSALVQLAGKLGIAHRVHFALWRADIPEILASSELLVLPSRWEGMPNVVLEAMAAGKPVVATAVEGVAEVLGERAADQIVAIGDMNAFADRVRQVAQSPQLAEDLGKSNRERVLREFSLQQMVARYERIFAELMATP